jgi:hypothetical protein
MATTEHSINDKLAEVLRETRSAWRVEGVLSSENTEMLRGSSARPDIVIIEANVSPVVIETEVLPAVTVEAEARERLGKHIRRTGREIVSAIAVRLPTRLRTTSTLKQELMAATDLEMALFAGRHFDQCVRWPQAGWLKGTVADLSILAQSASVPPDVIEAAADQLVIGVSEAAGLLAEIAVRHPGAVQKIGAQLFQEDDEQTRRMATTILANAFIFQESLAGGPGDLAEVRSLDEMAGAGALNKAAILSEWRRILKVNYWPIFAIACRILEVIPASDSHALIARLKEVSDSLANHLMRSHDLTGAIFQKLIADRKFLAAFYTTPAAAALLAGLAIKPDRTLAGGSWANASDVTRLRIADFACGTGTLLSTAYQRIGQLHELAGGDSEAIHPQMMAAGLVGCDVFPAAAHLTASMLSGAHPTVKYQQGSIMTVAYGKRPDGDIALGSIDLLDPQRRFEELGITATSLEGMGTKEREAWLSLPHASFDLVTMNPPFTRATGHHEINEVGVSNPVFAAFKATEEEQKEMSEATQRLIRGTSAHGNAGEASIFLVLADRKLRAGGTLALVMPLSLMAGKAWENSRRLLARGYSDLILVSIAGDEGAELSFSADTDMGECLVVGRKDARGSKRATFVILKERPNSTLLGASTAGQIRQLLGTDTIRRIEDGPVGGTPLYFGEDEIGQVIDAPLPKGEGGWNLSRISDLSLAQTAFQLADKGRIWLPTMSKSAATAIEMSTVGAIGEIGPLDRDIDGEGAEGAVRGPFKVVNQHSNSSTYPVLWSHDAERERTMAFPGDSEARPLKGSTKAQQRVIDEKVESVWESASHCHFNKDFRFNSQATAMQYTPRRTLGGRAWPTVKLAKADYEKALVLWGNSTFGLLLYWWHANKQQPGRGNIVKTSLKNLPVLNVSRLTAKQLKAAVSIFDEMSDKAMRPMNEMDNDPVRQELDKRLATEVLELKASVVAADGPLELLRKKLANEPSVRGSK